MTTQAVLMLVFFLIVLLAFAYPLASFLTRIADQQNPSPGEGWLYRISGADAQSDMSWKQYAIALLVFNVVGCLALYAQQRFQLWLPLNPQDMPNVSPDSSFKTTVSFTSNTNWQGYGGESTMSYLTQMLGLAVHNFVSAATGIAVAFALIRGFARRSAQGIGNFWVDLTRSTLYVLLPLSVIVTVILMSQGMIQNFDAYQEVTTLETLTYEQPKVGMEEVKTQTQTIAMGPVASQEAIKQLGTNGGGFFNANSAHPLENPTPLSNFIAMLSIFLIPAALTFVFGRMVGDIRQGWAVLAAMTAIFVVMALGAMSAEQVGNPLLASLGVDTAASDLQAGGNMESKEVRFGIVASALFAVVTTAASCGAVNAMHDSFMPLGGLIPMWLMQLGEVVFGGVGAGL